MFGDVNGEILIRSLEDRIEKWERCADGSLLIKPKKANFDELAVIFRRVFMDTEYDFVATISLMKDSKAKSIALELLKIFGDSFELRWKRRLLTKMPIFVNSTTRHGYDDESSKSDSGLEASLNSEKELMKKIQKLKPEELSINLVPLGSLDPSHLFPNQSPAQVSWVVSLSKIIYRSVGYTSKLRAIFDVLDDVSGVLKKISA